MFNLPSDVIVTMTPGSAIVAAYDQTLSTFLFSVFSLPGNPYAMTMADFTGDGLADMALQVDGVVQIVTAKDTNNVAAGLFAGTPGIFSTLIVAGTAITAGDFNGDGDLEVAIAVPQGGGTSILILDVAVIRSGTQITDIRVSQAGILFISTPSTVTEVALAAGDYDGAGFPDPDDELVVAYHYGANLLMSSIDPVVNSDNPNAYTPVVKNTQSVSTTVVVPNGGAGLVGLVSGRLDWFGSTEQVVVGFNQTDGRLTVSPSIVFTLDNNLNLSQGGSIVDASPIAGIALGNFDQTLGPNDPPNLQVAKLLPQTNNDLFVNIYQADPQNNFALSPVSDNEITSLPSQGGWAFAFAAGDTRGRSVLLGEPTKLTVQHVQPRLVLGMPPMHVDWVTDANGGGPEVLNLSAVLNTYYSRYQTVVTNQAQSSSLSKTSFTEATSETLSAGYQAGGAATGSVSISISESFALTHKNIVSQLDDHYTSTKFDVSVGTGFDDSVWFNDERHNIYIYPVIGQTVCPAGNPTCSASERLPLTVLFSGPDQIRQEDTAGGALEWFQPVWEPGNIFSYPWNLTQLQAQYPSVNLLTSDTPTAFYTDDSTRTEQATWAKGSSDKSSTGTATNISWDASVSVSKTPSNVTGGFSGSAKLDYNGSDAISTLNTSTTTLGQSTGIGIVKPGTFPNPNNYQYGIMPFIFGNDPVEGTVETVDLDTDITTNGILHAAFTADPTDPSAGSWWQGAYTSPDLALNHPARWNVSIQSGSGDTPANCIKTSISTQNSCASFNFPNTGNQELWNSEFFWMKGLLITPAAAPADSPQITQAVAGDPVRLQARVYNYSLVDMPTGSNAVVQFYGQPWQASCPSGKSSCTPNTPIGDSFLIENVPLKPIPGFNSQSNNGEIANWAVAETTRLDTAAHADQHLIFWVLVVFKDAEGNPLAEMPGHGLTGIPPTQTSIAGAATWLEPYSNNLGYYHSVFYIAPQTTVASAAEARALQNAKTSAPAGKGGLNIKRFKVEPRSALVNEKVSVSVELHAGDEALDGVAVSFYDGDPKQGGKLFDQEQITHIRANEVAEARVPFRATTCGVHTLYVETHPQTNTAKTVLNVRSKPAAGGAGARQCQ